MKTLAMIVRRKDHTREAFRAHYEDIHAPLAMETVMEGTIYYVRHHIADEVHGCPFFDVVTAFEYRDNAAAAKLMERLGGPEGERIIADEHTFMDRDRNTFFAVEERLVSGAPDRTAGFSAIALVKAPAESEREGFVRDYEAESIPALLDATKSPVWCLQNRALALGGPPPAFDLATQVHAAGDDNLSGWAATLESGGAEVVVIGVSEHETDTPWS
jgi:hypothetical protein